jgi:iron complex transport system substrate-binding protein
VTAPLHRLAALLLLAAACARAEIVVRDDAGHELHLAAPAQRILSLSPHGTELLFDAGAGAKIVGTVEHSDYPSAANAIPRVGTYVEFDLERILALHPDLAVVWASGNGSVIERLAALGIPVYVTEPRQMEDIPAAIERLGRLAGTPTQADATARRFRTRLQALRNRYSARPTVTLFYQAWRAPLFTLGGPHLFSRVAELCGGRNAFAALDTLAPPIDVEAVLAADPEAIVASGMGEERPDWLDDWKRWPQLRAVRNGHLFFIPPDLLQRPTPRLLDGAEQLCRDLEQVRKDRVR